MNAEKTDKRRTKKDYWLSFNGKIRTARKDHACDGLGSSERFKCIGSGTIQKGNKYLDTCEIYGGPFRTMKMCLKCADREG